ncbi:hypothetical protein Pmar_PMAR013105 [Perkinsus marinus ATCC 50983]|uniref:Uncharacterized protein n=1 Tax=Perkinsus marinus (strain ATCC 50983 / TXsc) TaxID=423536 RepID=C5L4X5_PERM5|nr:hypothetical protein Pmar_PMAR013105 [Perkinsus marinus ATCC 50983]EER08195.1 hypothetical protein Pmar_PMAR013105 [Perkinsus marinus ATCC 50983]|eukprot:XP_002776379.1 hypothetical protein Pmar_PMAR013105 [Perkinsus marinus ATCC 50983]
MAPSLEQDYEASDVIEEKERPTTSALSTRGWKKFRRSAPTRKSNQIHIRTIDPPAEFGKVKVIAYRDLEARKLGQPEYELGVGVSSVPIFPDKRGFVDLIPHLVQIQGGYSLPEDRHCIGDVFITVIHCAVDELECLMGENTRILCEPHTTIVVPEGVRFSLYNKCVNEDAVICVFLTRRYALRVTPKEQADFVWSARGKWNLLMFGGLGDAIGGLLGFIGQPYVSGVMYSLMNQAIVPFTVIFSLLILGTRYISLELIGVLIVLLAVCMSMHNFSASHSDPFMAALIALSTSGNALSFVLKEKVFRAFVAWQTSAARAPLLADQRSSPRKLDVFVVNCCVSVFQVLWLLPVRSVACVLVTTTPPADATDPDDLALSGLWWSKDGNSLLLNYRGSDMYEIKSLDKVELTRPTTSPASSMGSKSVVAVETSNLRVYTGRRNEETFAKECCMLNGDRYVATGGDCGHVYIWDRCTQRLQRKIKADTFVVNCVAPHPLGEPFLLTSGIDSDVKLWHTGTIRHTLKRDCSNNLLNGGLSRPLRSRLFGSQREDEAPTTIITIEEIRGRIDRANSKRQHANDAFRESRYQTALVLYSEVLDLLRYNSTEESDELERERRECAAITYSNMTACHIKLSSWADGLAASNSALELEPYLLKAILRRARCKFELNDFNGCRDDLSIAEHHRDIGPSGLHEIRKLRHEIAVKERESRRREQSFFARIFG